MQVLTALFDFIKDETRRNPYMHLKGLMENFDLMKASNLPLPLVQVNGTDKGVNLLTAHGSKGLEFKHVFVVGSEADVWEKKRKNNSDFKYQFTGNESQNVSGLRDILNEKIKDIAKNKTNIIGELSCRYNFKKIFLQPTIAFGKFINTNFSVQYEF